MTIITIQTVLKMIITELAPLATRQKNSFTQTMEPFSGSKKKNHNALSL
jgi:hypothetical protein